MGNRIRRVRGLTRAQCITKLSTITGPVETARQVCLLTPSDGAGWLNAALRRRRRIVFLRLYGQQGDQCRSHRK